jgi:hypothetical protein
VATVGGNGSSDGHSASVSSSTLVSEAWVDGARETLDGYSGGDAGITVAFCCSLKYTKGFCDTVVYFSLASLITHNSMETSTT